MQKYEQKITQEQNKVEVDANHDKFWKQFFFNQLKVRTDQLNAQYIYMLGGEIIQGEVNKKVQYITLYHPNTANSVQYLTKKLFPELKYIGFLNTERTSQRFIHREFSWHTQFDIDYIINEGIVYPGDPIHPLIKNQMESYRARVKQILRDGPKSEKHIADTIILFGYKSAQFMDLMKDFACKFEFDMKVIKSLKIPLCIRNVEKSYTGFAEQLEIMLGNIDMLISSFEKLM